MGKYRYIQIGKKLKVITLQPLGECRNCGSWRKFSSLAPMMAGCRQEKWGAESGGVPWWRSDGPSPPPWARPQPELCLTGTSRPSVAGTNCWDGWEIGMAELTHPRHTHTELHNGLRTQAGEEVKLWGRKDKTEKGKWRIALCFYSRSPSQTIKAILKIKALNLFLSTDRTSSSTYFFGIAAFPALSDWAVFRFGLLDNDVTVCWRILINGFYVHAVILVDTLWHEFLCVPSPFLAT